MSEERIRRLEEQVAELYSHLGLRQGPPGQSPGVSFAGNSILRGGS